MPSARESVQALKAQGYTHAEIAQSISGRGDRPLSSSYISKIATGKKPARNLEGPLDELATQGSVPLSGAPRRTRATGEAARVRGGYEETQTGFAREVGQYGVKDIRNTLQRAADANKQIKLRVHARRVRKYRGRLQSPGYVDLFDKGGYSARRVLDMLQRIGAPDIRDGLMVLAGMRPDVEEIEGFLGVEVVAFG